MSMHGATAAPADQPLHRLRRRGPRGAGVCLLRDAIPDADRAAPAGRLRARAVLALVLCPCCGDGLARRLDFHNVSTLRLTRGADG